MRFLKAFLTCCVMTVLFLACEQATEQVSGVIGQLNFSTYACQPEDHSLIVRNDNLQEPQRVQGVMFELGTNNDNFYKISKVVSNGIAYTGNGKIVSEIIIPAGGFMEIFLTYNPRKVTFGMDMHVSYLDIVLNGPQLGILQVKLDGTAPATLPNCGVSDTTELEVVSVTTYLVHKVKFGDTNNKSELNVSTNVKGNFNIALDESAGTAAMTEAGWPEIILTLPPGSAAIPELSITLAAGEYKDGTYDGKDVEISGLSVSVSGLAEFPDTILTSKAVTLTSEAAELKLQGSAKDAAGNMTLVVGAVLTKKNFQLLPADMEGAIFGAEIKVRQK